VPVYLSTGQKYALLPFYHPLFVGTQEQSGSPLPMYEQPKCLRNRRVIQHVPLLTGLRIMSGIGTGMRGIISSSLIFKNLSLEVGNALDTKTKCLWIDRDKLTL
jgi:hypothetical protein